MSMIDTPRTDAELRDNRPSVLEQEMGEIETVHADFARQLERELAAANRSCDACLQEIDRLREARNRSYREPVAWRWRVKGTVGWRYGNEQPNAGRLPASLGEWDGPEPLYASPTCERDQSA